MGPNLTFGAPTPSIANISENAHPMLNSMYVSATRIELNGGCKSTAYGHLIKCLNFNFSVTCFRSFLFIFILYLFLVLDNFIALSTLPRMKGPSETC